MVTFDFIKFSFSRNPLAYGTAEADEMIASQAAPGRGEAMHPWGILGGGGYSIYPGMGRCGRAQDIEGILSHFI